MFHIFYHVSGIGNGIGIEVGIGIGRVEESNATSVYSTDEGYHKP